MKTVLYSLFERSGDRGFEGESPKKSFSIICIF